MPASANIFFVSSYSPAYALEQKRVINSPTIKVFSIVFIESLLLIISQILSVVGGFSNIQHDDRKCNEGISCYAPAFVTQIKGVLDAWQI
jgi:hypothetical protein